MQRGANNWGRPNFVFHKCLETGLFSLSPESGQIKTSPKLVRHMNNSHIKNICEHKMKMQQIMKINK